MQCTSMDTGFCSTVSLNSDSNSMLGLTMSLSFSVSNCLCSHSHVQGMLNIACASAYLSQGTQSAATVHTHVEIYLSLCSLGQFEFLKYKTKVKYCRSQLKSIYNKKQTAFGFAVVGKTPGDVGKSEEHQGNVALACSPSRWFLVRGILTSP